MWVGEKHYKTPGHFLKEANSMGISKRIATVPRDFVVGETWIMLAHMKAVIDPHGKEEPKPGIFRAFRPTAIEYVVTGKEAEAELDKMEERGFTLVDVKKKNEQGEIFEDDNN